ncbi:MAG: DUF6288 domain-containing protein [Planctomycetia bacterium]
MSLTNKAIEILCLIVGLAGAAWHAGALAGQGSYPLGDLGGRAALVEGQPRQLRIVSVHPGQPAAAAGIAEGDVIEGLAGSPFGEGYMMPLRQLGAMLDAAAGGDGVLKLTISRGGRPREISVRLPKAGRFAATYPYACPKSELIYRHACTTLAAELQRGTLPGGELTTALAAMGLMGDRSGRGLEAARPTVLRIASEYAGDPRERNIWVLSYVGVMLCEYQMMSPDPVVDAAIRRIAGIIVKQVPRHGRYGHNINDADPEDLPYGGAGLNATTTAALWFFASAARVGVEPSALEPAFSRAFKRVRDDTNAGGGVGYAWADDHQSCMRSGHMALACNHVVQVPAWLAAEPRQLVTYRTAVASWPTRHADDLLEAHAVSSLGLTASTAGLASFDVNAHHALMQHWRWYFTLSWQPTAGSDRELAYVGGPNNTGGDFYLNGFRGLENDGFNSIMNATVAFIFAAGQERLSFYGGMPGVPGLSTAVLATSPGLQQATAAMRRRKYGEAHRLATRVAEGGAGKPTPNEPAKGEGGAADAIPSDPRGVAAAFVRYVEEKHLAPALELARSRLHVGDVVAAADGLKKLVAEVRGIEAFESPARELLHELKSDDHRDALRVGLAYHQLEFRARKGSKAALEELDSFAAKHRDSFYGAAAQRLAASIRSGGPMDRDVAGGGAPSPSDSATAGVPPLPDDPGVLDADDPPLSTSPMTLDELFGPGESSPQAPSTPTGGD